MQQQATHTDASLLSEQLEYCVRQAASADFFSLVALLEQLTGAVGVLGSSGFPRHESIRFKHSPELSFSASDIDDVHVGKRAQRDAAESYADSDSTDLLVQLTTTFLGLTGATSPLPLYLTESALEDPKDSALQDFLDLFHHRAISLLYRWVIRHRLDVHLASDHSDAWSKRLLALGGADDYSADAPLSAQSRPIHLRLLPLLANRQRSAASLERALIHILSQSLMQGEPHGSSTDLVQVSVRSWVGDWIFIEQSEQVRLGAKANRLGESARLGRRQLDPAACFRVCIGPLRSEAYRRCGRGGDLEPVVQETIKLFCPIGTRYEIALVLHAEDAPAFATALQGDPLGRNMWLQGNAREKTVYITETTEDNQKQFFALQTQLSSKEISYAR